MLTIDRFEQTKQVTEANLKNIGTAYQLAIIDNGSTDKRLLEWIPQVAHYYRLNRENEGVARMQNWGMNTVQKECTHIVLMGNDIEMPNGWGSELLKACSAIENPGLIGIDCLGKIKESTEKQSGHYRYWETERVFGTMMIPEGVFNKVGYMNNVFHPYGIEDTDYNYRVQVEGFTSAYLHGLSSNHAGADTESQSDYRKMKWDSLTANHYRYEKEVEKYKASGKVYLPLNNNLTPEETFRIYAVNPIKGNGGDSAAT
jgi:GT2 family glycosyltransferase